MRYLPLSEPDRQEMLKTIGVSAVDDLFKDVPRSVLLDKPVDLPATAGEMAVEQTIGALAGKNTGTSAVPSFLGVGAYRHHVPSAIDYLVQRGEFLTSYTPYQPEISQGTLQYLFEFQTQVALLTGMEVANASLYDGATAVAEAMLMASRITKRNKAILSGGLHPHYRDVAVNQAKFMDFQVTCADPDPLATEDLSALIDNETACVIVQNPGFFGQVRDLSALSEACHEAGALLVVAVAEVVSLGAIKSPGAMGADIVIGEGQSLGNGLSFGGPYLGLMACRQKFLRQMPGRLAGETVDVEGRRGWVLTLSTREQHIRREKATSNICTNSGLCALAFTMHLTMLGEAGFTRLAKLNHVAASKLADRLATIEGVELVNDTFFNEFTLRLPKAANEVVEALAEKGILGGVPVSRLHQGVGDLGNLLLVAATELNTDDQAEAFQTALKEVL